jgi:hypothetical protein
MVEQWPLFTRKRPNRRAALSDDPGHKRSVFVGVPSVCFLAESGLAICPKSN